MSPAPTTGTIENDAGALRAALLPVLEKHCKPDGDYPEIVLRRDRAHEATEPLADLCRTLQLLSEGKFAAISRARLMRLTAETETDEAAIGALAALDDSIPRRLAEFSELHSNVLVAAITRQKEIKLYAGRLLNDSSVDSTTTVDSALKRAVSVLQTVENEGLAALSPDQARQLTAWKMRDLPDDVSRFERRLQQFANLFHDDLRVISSRRDAFEARVTPLALHSEDPATTAYCAR